MAFLSQEVLGGVAELRDALPVGVHSRLLEGQEIAAKIDAGQLFLATGNAQDMLLERIESDRAETVEGLGLLPGHAAYHMLQRHNSFFLGKLGDMDIVGFKSIFGHTYGAGEENGLFTAVRGVRWNRRRVSSQTP